MVTPQEIELKEFSRVMRGYDRDEVDEFLDLIIVDMQELLKTLDNLRTENEMLKEDIEEYKRSEQKVMETMESAKRLMNDMNDSAEKRAETIIQNAKMDAEQILMEARRNVDNQYIPTGEELHDKLQVFRSRYRQMLLDELENLDAKSGDLLSELEKEFIPASMDTQVLDFDSLMDMEEAPKENAYPRPKDTVVLDEAAIDELLKNEDRKIDD